MHVTFLTRLVPYSKMLAALASITFAVTSCGGGGSENSKNEPAPYTFNGLVLNLDNGGLKFEFIGSGNSTSGNDSGAVILTGTPTPFSIITSSGAIGGVNPSPTISRGHYTYTRRSPESGRLVITGEGLISNGAGTYNYMGGQFSRTYDILFASTGALITGIQVTDYDTVDLPSSVKIFWNNSTLSINGSVAGRQVPTGWDSTQASTMASVPPLYPDKISPQQLILTPTDAGDPELFYQLLQSDYYNKKSGLKGDFEERGTGQVQTSNDLPGTTPPTIKYGYQPVAGQSVQVHLKLYNDVTGVLIDYLFVFDNKENGTYSYSDATGIHTGRFEFPFIDQST